ncbi:primosomal protein N', partial [Rhodospirillum rubrum]|uniref:primosomal protein N' n=1 Tax=Rhodospirillum rubrum TaxID=1085 RepID=UPI001903D07B
FRGGARLSPGRQRVLAVLDDHPGLPFVGADLAREAAVGPAVVAAMAKAGLLEAVTRSNEWSPQAPDADRPGPLLSADQQAAADGLRTALDQGFSGLLLEGVTGSGKTEVYFEAIAETLRRGRQALVLLPEIALAAQWPRRFADRFGAAPVQWHSQMGAAARRRAWRAVALGLAPVVVGARSALFLPYPDLGLIIVDEEHDSAFKQEEGVPYNARDMAVVRARLGGFPAVLASATPSLETIENARQGRYRHLVLPRRHGGAEMPEITLLDLRRAPPQKWLPTDFAGPGGSEGLAVPGAANDEAEEQKAAPSSPTARPARLGWLSPPLITAVEETLAAGEQVLLFLNRRGYAPLTLCRSCGHRLKCPRCTAWLVEHRRDGRLRCHHCGYQQPIPETCPACGVADSLAPCGPGVERLAEEAAHRFPKARMEVAASDTVTGPKEAAALATRIANHDIDLIVGTQIMAKGHHFPLITLVGVVDGDLGLTGGDLRASERTHQLLHQVAGRAGRAERPGRVLIQTVDPGHPVMEALASGDPALFLEVEAAERQALAMPPFGRLVALVISGEDSARVQAVAAALGRAAPMGPGLDVLGPVPAPLAMLRGRHRHRLLLKAARGVKVQPVVRHWLSLVSIPPGVKVQVDVDPISFL